MKIPTEPIGSIPRLLDAIAERGNPWDPSLDPPYEDAIRDTIARFEATGSPVITDDCGFSPFSDDRSTTREKAFEKIRARVAGTAMASEILEAERERASR